MTKFQLVIILETEARGDRDILLLSYVDFCVYGQKPTHRWHRDDGPANYEIYSNENDYYPERLELGYRNFNVKGMDFDEVEEIIK